MEFLSKYRISVCIKSSGDIKYLVLSGASCRYNKTVLKGISQCKSVFRLYIIYNKVYRKDVFEEALKNML